jgi:hypothetical protein
MFTKPRVKWVPCQHAMAHPQYMDRGEGLQIWKVAMTLLNKQSRHQRRCGPPVWRSDRVLTTPHCRRSACYEMLHRTSGC